VFRPSIEKRLSAVSTELRRLRNDLKILDEQILQVSDEAEDSRLRALVSETPLAAAEHRDAAKAVGALRRNRDSMMKRLQKLEALQDQLLDEFTGS
jgi:chromosome segregation ATPase